MFFAFGAKCGPAGAAGTSVVGGEQLLVQQRSQRERAHAGAALLKKFAAGDALQSLQRWAFEISHDHVHPLVSVSSRFNSTLATIIQAASLRTSRLSRAVRRHLT